MTYKPNLEDAISDLAEQRAINSCLMTIDMVLEDAEHRAMVFEWLKEAIHSEVQCMVCDHIWHPSDGDHELRTDRPGAFFFVTPGMRAQGQMLVSPVCKTCAAGEPQQVAAKCHRVLNELFDGDLEVVAPGTDAAQ